ncbi:MAG: 50S ribosomal protein L11 methyltransferase [Verrucomicrobiae bacterium]|nr:50S ribosomal protein L11 methyltransferase [Verrucomicrobiae bacterium]
MKQKPLWRISAATSLEAEDAVTELLGSLTGQPAAAYFNLETRTSLVSVFADQPFPRKIRAEIAAGLKQIKGCGLAIGTGKIEIAKVKREDWAESWKKHFKPIEIGRSLLVKPSWIKQKPQSGQAVIILDPGLSFGTGQHPTTSFCLGEICRVTAATGNSGSVKSFLDIGTGSGILAIGAAKLGFQPVHAFDFDPESVRVAKANARVNGVERKLKITRGDVTKLPVRTEKKFHLVCANLISNLLIAEKKKIAAQVRRDGTLVLAGILAEEFSLVQRAFEDLGMKLAASRVENEWCSGSFCFV